MTILIKLAIIFTLMCMAWGAVEGYEPHRPLAERCVDVMVHALFGFICAMGALLVVSCVVAGLWFLFHGVPE